MINPLTDLQSLVNKPSIKTYIGVVKSTDGDMVTVRLSSGVVKQVSSSINAPNGTSVLIVGNQIMSKINHQDIRIVYAP